MPDASGNTSGPMTYAGSGVDYDALDAFKRACQREASTTIGLLEEHGLREAEGTRGESAYLIETPDGYLAHVEEGLGTKNLVADALEAAGGPRLYRNVGIDTVATIVNDLITVGCLPAVVAMHAAVGDSAWFNGTKRAADLAAGFAEGCRMAGATWGGGETPALAGIVRPEAIVLAGSAIGRMDKGDRVRGDVQPGDRMIFLASSGVHTNGLTLCRDLADRLPQGYLTPVGDTTYGEALLEPSRIYADFVAQLRKHKVRPKYLAHVTGHGWRKLMRLEAPLRYRVTDPGNVPAIFDFIAGNGPVERREMYATFNMGVGFVAYVLPDAVDATLKAAEAAGHPAWVGGEVLDGEGARSVEVPSLGLTFAGEELKVR